MKHLYTLLLTFFVALSAHAASDNQITMTYADGKLEIKTTNNDPYFYFIETKADYDAFNPDLSQKWINEELATWIGIETYYNKLNMFVIQGDETIDINEFWSTHRNKGDAPDAEYIALAAGFENGVMTTDGCYLLFNHSGDTTIDDTPQSFDITVTELTPVSATVNVTPANKKATYYFNIMTADELSNFKDVNDLAESYCLKFDETISYYEETFGSILTYRSFLFDGPSVFSYGDLTPNTDYYVVCYGFDADTALPTTELFTLPFKTGDASFSDNDISMTYSGDEIHITTTNDDPYFFIFELVEEYQGFVPDYSESSLKEEINNWMELVTNYGMEDRLIHQGDKTINLPEFWSTYLSQEPMYENEYIAIVGGYNVIVNTVPKYLIFHYGEEDGITNLRIVSEDTCRKILENGRVTLRQGHRTYNTQGIRLQ